ncbi:MAG: hypothetical protein WBF67_09870, partial [Olleya sp.]
MKHLLKYTILFLILLSLWNCGDSSENDNCTKTITIPQYYNVFNQVYSYNSTLEVPCDYPEPTGPQALEHPPILQNFTYEVLSLIYTPDTGNNTSRLQFDIQLNNNNDFAVQGIT